MIEVIPLADALRWRSVVGALPHGFAHTWENCYAQYLTTRYETFLLHLAAGSAAAICPLAERVVAADRDAVTPYGFSGFVATHASHQLPFLWQDFARRRRYVCAFIPVNPLFRSVEFHEEDVFPNTFIYALDLTLPTDVLLSRMSRNRRRQLRNWTPTTHIDDRKKLTTFFLDHYHAFMRRKGARGEHEFSLETLSFLCTQPNVMLLGARSEGREITDVLIVGFTPHSADALFNVSTSERNRQTAPLFWTAVHRLKELGVRWLNLGGGVRPGDAIAQSKERFGAAELPYRAIKQVLRTDRYAELCRAVGKNPDARSGYFPAYRARPKPRPSDERGPQVP